MMRDAFQLIEREAPRKMGFNVGTRAQGRSVVYNLSDMDAPETANSAMARS